MVKAPCIQPSSSLNKDPTESLCNPRRLEAPRIPRVPKPSYAGTECSKITRARIDFEVSDSESLK